MACASRTAALDADRVAIIDSERWGIALGNESVARWPFARALQRVSVADVAIHARGASSPRGCVLAADGAELLAARLLCTGARGAAILATGPGTSLDLEQAIITDVEPAAGGGAGVAISVEMRAAAVVRAVELARISDIGVSLDGGAIVSVEDLTTSEPGEPSSASGGLGVRVARGAALTLLRASMAPWPNATLDVGGGGSTLDASDVQVRAPAAMTSGDGVYVHAGATATLTACEIGAFGAAAIRVADRASEIELRDVLVEPMGMASSPQLSGVVATGGGALRGERVRVAGVRGVGLGAFASGSSIVLDDVRVEGVSPDPAAESAATGAGAYGGATVELMRFHIVQAQTVGAQLVGPSTLMLSTGSIVESPVGVVVPAGTAIESVVVGDVRFVDCPMPSLFGTLPAPRSPD